VVGLKIFAQNFWKRRRTSGAGGLGFYVCLRRKCGVNKVNHNYITFMKKDVDLCIGAM
jgi:hypothetical protein